MPKKRPRTRPALIYELRVTIRGIKPPVWRDLLVFCETSLHDFHRVIQESFGWQDYHLYEFALGRRRFEDPQQDEATGEDATAVSLADLELKKGSALTYTYDFGDEWVHDVRVVGPRVYDAGQTYPACIDGARAGPPEDCGGPRAYEELTKILADPRHPEFLTRREWTGQHFHPECFDLRATNRILGLAFG